jgi:hypothetical protein
MFPALLFIGLPMNHNELFRANFSNRELISGLLLTRLGAEEYFLQPFLFLFRRWPMLVVYLGMTLAAVIAATLFGSSLWADSTFIAPAFVGFCLVLLARPAAMLCYATDWRLFAGKPLTASRIVMLILIIMFSAYLTLGLSFFLLMACRLSVLLAILFLLPAFFLSLSAAAWLAARSVYRNAERILWEHMRGNDHDARLLAEKTPGPLMVIFPWLWPRPRSQADRAAIAAVNIAPRQRIYWILAALGFAVVFNIGSHTQLVRFFLESPSGFSSLLPYFLTSIIGIILITGWAIYCALAFLHRKTLGQALSPRLFLAVAVRPAGWIALIGVVIHFSYYAVRTLFFYVNVQNMNNALDLLHGLPWYYFSYMSRWTFCLAVAMWLIPRARRHAHPPDFIWLAGLVLIAWLLGFVLGYIPYLMHFITYPIIASLQILVYQIDFVTRTGIGAANRYFDLWFQITLFIVSFYWLKRQLAAARPAVHERNHVDLPPRASEDHPAEKVAASEAPDNFI